MKNANPHLKDAIDEFLSTKLALSRNTHAAYFSLLKGSTRGTKVSLGTPVGAYFHGRRVRSITETQMLVCFNQRVEGGRQDTKHRMSKGLREFCTFLHDRGYTDTNIGAPIPKIPAGGARKDWYELKTAKRIADKAESFNLYFAILWLFLTGCRVSEAISAQQSDVKRLDDGTYLWIIPDSKTHMPREVTLPDFLGAALERSRAQNNPKPDWPVLWGYVGRGFGRRETVTAYLTAPTIRGVMARAGRAAGIYTKVTPHTAKHSYCTNRLRLHVSDEPSLAQLSVQVGTSIAQLRRAYLHHTFDEVDRGRIRSIGQDLA